MSTTRSRPGWDFFYEAIPARTGEPLGVDVVVATRRSVEPRQIAKALVRLLPDAEVETVLDRAPLAWTRVRSVFDAELGAIARQLRQARVALRYVASARCGSMELGARLDVRDAIPARPRAWRGRRATHAPEMPSDGRWFLRDDEGGVAVRRATCGTGAGTRLAVVDDDVAGVEHLDLDDVVLVGVDEAPIGHEHAALMVGWAVGARAPRPFRGVAPDASPRLYVIPKPGADVLSLPLAIARAVDDGADVVLCATHIGGATSPMLDDALTFAARLGRGGRGAAVVVPTGREASSPASSVHASWTLGLGEPASDPRVLCVGPSQRGGGWFYWRDRRGRFRPFGNRGPAVRWLAPGDDIAYPFAASERPFHAESSGASAIAAGVLLLVLAQNPRLRLDELERVVTATLEPVDPEHRLDLVPLADNADALPVVRDRDGHNAKHGYGLLHAERACLAAADPVTAALVAIGEEGAARAYHARRARDPSLRAAYSRRAARELARALLVSEGASHAARAIARHARLVAGHPERARASGPGALARQLALFIRAAELASRPLPGTAQELRALPQRIARAPSAGALEALLFDLFDALFECSRPNADAPSSTFDTSLVARA